MNAQKRLGNGGAIEVAFEKWCSKFAQHIYSRQA